MALAFQLWHRLRANLHGLCGRAWFRLRRPQRARQHFETVLRLLGDDFAAHLYLGRIAYAGGDYAGWRRELRSAYRADPSRFTRLAANGFRGAGLDLGEEAGPQLAGTGVDPDLDPSAARRQPAEATRRRTAPGKKSDTESGIMPDRQTPDERVADVLRAMLEAAGASDLEDDCTTEQERDRFKSLGPIQPGDIRSCDLDDLTRRFGA
jgi:hypothetical protein